MIQIIEMTGMVATDKNDRPKNAITIHQAAAFQGPPPSGTLQQQPAQFAQLTSSA